MWYIKRRNERLLRAAAMRLSRPKVVAWSAWVDMWKTVRSRASRPERRKRLAASLDRASYVVMRHILHERTRAEQEIATELRGSI